MKLTKPLMLAGPLLVMASCQTTPLPEPLDVPALQREAVAEAKTEFCRGQEPLQAVHPSQDGAEPEPITLADLRAAPPWVRGYIEANNAQWREECES